MRPSRALFILLFTSLCDAAMAQDWNFRQSDVLLNRDQLGDLTAGNTLVFHDDGQSKFSVGGAYSYTYANDGGTAFGLFRIEPDGRVCIDFDNGFGRCDLYVKSGGLIVMLTETGDRFPIRVQINLRP